MESGRTMPGNRAMESGRTVRGDYGRAGNSG